MRKVYLVSFLVFLLPACSTFDSRSPEEIVADRAQKRVDALMAGEYEVSYQYTTPSYRTTEGVGRYGTRWAGVGMWLSATVSKVECRGGERIDRCKVAIEVLYKAARYEPTVTFLSEDWLLIDGDWYLYQKLGE